MQALLRRASWCAVVLGGGVLAIHPAQHVAPAGPAKSAPPLATTVIVVRHAEKDSADAEDPGLADQGRERAADLARLLAPAGVDRLFASEYRRTQDTLKPIAERSGLALEVVPARELELLAAELRALQPGDTAVVAGHSNTVPALLAALGAPLAGSAPGLATAALAEDEYDRLFVLTLVPGAKPSLLELAYGR